MTTPLTHSVISQFLDDTLGGQRPAVDQLMSELTVREAPASIHPYGFVIFRIADDFEGFDVRAHVWHPSQRPRQKPDWPPHLHNSNLFSLVLLGRIENRVWSFRDEAPYQGQVYNVNYNSNRSELVKTKNVGHLVSQSIQTVRAGSSYDIKKLKYHESFVEIDEWAITLALVSRRVSGHSKVFGDISGQKLYTFERAALPMQLELEARNKASEILDNIVV